VTVRSFRNRYRKACAAVAAAVADSKAYAALRAELAAAATATATGGSVTIHVDASGRVLSPAGELVVPGPERADNPALGGGGHFLSGPDGGPDDRKALDGAPRQLEPVCHGALLGSDFLHAPDCPVSCFVETEAVNGPRDLPQLASRSDGRQRGDVAGNGSHFDRPDLAGPVRRPSREDVTRGLAV
jgi:hypothetical protein